MQIALYPVNVPSSIAERAPIVRARIVISVPCSGEICIPRLVRGARSRPQVHPARDLVMPMRDDVPIKFRVECDESVSRRHFFSPFRAAELALRFAGLSPRQGVTLTFRIDPIPKEANPSRRSERGQP